MKSKIIAVSVILLIVILVYLFAFRKRVNITDIKSFHLSYTTGAAMFSNVYYDLTCEDKCIAKIKPNNLPDTETREIEVDTEVKEEITKLMKKYQVEKWNGFNKYDKHVLDGHSFHLKIQMEDDSIIASGYMKYPKNYKNFVDEIDLIFSEIYKK